MKQRITARAILGNVVLVALLVCQFFTSDANLRETSLAAMRGDELHLEGRTSKRVTALDWFRESMASKWLLWTVRCVSRF